MIQKGVMVSAYNLRIMLHLPPHTPLAPQGWAAGVGISLDDGGSMGVQGGRRGPL
jgi:hypothetical protein